MISLNSIGIRYGEQNVVSDVSFTLEKGEIGCLLGASGSGKSSILRAIAGFNPVSQGAIYLRGKEVVNQGRSTPPEQRKIAMMFQDFALFPHLNVAENVSFGLTHFDSNAKSATVTEMLELVGLPGIENRAVHQLSGGQQQRVALARAIAPKPDVILLDEPFSSLDTDLRQELAEQVREILKDRNITAMLVTHDHQEAMFFSDKLGVLQAGKLQQWDEPYQVYHQPASEFVATFVGGGQFLEAEVVDANTVSTIVGDFTSGKPIPAQCERLKVLIRPDDVVLAENGPYSATVVKKQFRGAEILYTLNLNGSERVKSLNCVAPSHQQYEIGNTVSFHLDLEHLVWFE